MISRQEIIDSFLKSVDILINEKLKKVKFDKTIVCDLIECLNGDELGNVNFKLQYQNDIFEAISNNQNIINAVEDIETYRYRVRVLIPENDWKNQKYILGIEKKIPR